MEPSLWQIIVLAIVQGVAEFLPISSSGHVVILAAILSPRGHANLDVSNINIVLHLGTLLSILVVYFDRIRQLLTTDRRMFGMLAVATMPAVVIGLPVKLHYDKLLENTLLAGCLLIVTGLMLLATTRWRRTEKEEREIGFGEALTMGLAQAAAIFPGLSRSGSTITTGLALGLSPKVAATFAFLMAIPVIAGAGVLEIYSLTKEGPGSTSAATLAIGCFVSFGVGLVSLRWLLRCLERGRFHWFAWWCIPVGVAVVVWQLVG